MINCNILQYDKTITEPPFKFIKVGTVQVVEPKGKDEGGVELAERLTGAVRAKGYIFKFYTMSKEKTVTYDIIVYD